MIRHLTAIVAAVAALALVALPAIGAPGLLKNKYSPDEVTVVCTDSSGNDVGEVVYEGPLKMWPPNHKYQPIAVVATAEDPDDEVRLTTAGTHDEFLEDGSELNGAGNTDNDVDPLMDSDSGTGSATTEHSLRSERSGQGDGRTYTLDWHATFGENSCGSAELHDNGQFDPSHDAFEVLVPHDMRCGADWKGGNRGNGGNGQCAQD